MKTLNNTLSRFSGWAGFTLCGLSIVLLASPAQAFELSRGSTRAEWVGPTEEGAPPYIDLNTSAEIRGLETSYGELTVTWEAVGGIEPAPFKLIIPARCFRPEEGSIQVRNYRSCGVKAVLELADVDQLSLPIQAFTAVVTERSGTTRVSITAAVDSATDIGDMASMMLGAIGGGRQIVQVGDASASLLPNVVNVFGFDPQPEPPANPR